MGSPDANAPILWMVSQFGMQRTEVLALNCHILLDVDSLESVTAVVIRINLSEIIRGRTNVPRDKFA